MTTLIIAIVLAAFVPSPQSLGEIAKKAAAEKAAKREAEAGQTQPPTKVFTDKDLASDPLAADKPVAPPIGKEESAAAVMIAAAAKSEAYWRGRLAPMREQLTSDMLASDVVARNLDEVRAKLEPNLVSLAVFGPEVVRLTTELKNWNAIVAADVAAIERLKEEGRRGGAFPGWFR